MDTVPCLVPCRTAHKLSMWTTVRTLTLSVLLSPCRKERKVSWMLHWFFIEPLLSYKHVAIDTSTNKYPAQSALHQLVYTHTHIYTIYIDILTIHISCNCLERAELELKPSERLHMQKDLPRLAGKRKGASNVINKYCHVDILCVNRHNNNNNLQLQRGRVALRPVSGICDVFSLCAFVLMAHFELSCSPSRAILGNYN